MNIVNPEEVGLSSTQLKRINYALQVYVDQGEIPGAIALVARRGKIAYLEALGMMDIEEQKPMLTDSIFRCYSMTKPITSVAIMMLYEQGYFKLDDPVSIWIPAFRHVKVYSDENETGMIVSDLEHEVTFRQLLTHTSGLIYDNPNGNPVEKMVWNRDKKEDIIKAPNDEVVFYRMTDEPLADWVSRLLTVPLAHQPGKGWSYGYSYEVVGYLIELISGVPLDRFFQERVFDPLGMVDTTFHLPEQKINRFSTMYCPNEMGSFKVLDRGKSSYWLPRKDYLSGGGDHGNALVSTVHDYYRFCQMLLNSGELDGERLLSRNTIVLMTTHNLTPGINMPDSPGVGIGLGFWVMLEPGKAKIYSSKGSFGGGGFAGTSYWVDPSEGLIGIIAIQNPGWSWDAQNKFPALVYQAIND